MSLRNKISQVFKDVMGEGRKVQKSMSRNLCIFGNIQNEEIRLPDEDLRDPNLKLHYAVEFAG